MKFKILDVQWHIGHQYEMLKFPFVEWSWLMQYKRRGFSKSFAEILVICSSMYAATSQSLRCRHSAFRPGLSRSSFVGVGKGSVYRDMNEIIDDIPKIVIMHGTPYRPEGRVHTTIHNG